jgi:hypothetical protein
MRLFIAATLLFVFINSNFALAELIKGKEAEQIIANGNIKDRWTHNRSTTWRYYLVSYKRKIFICGVSSENHKLDIRCESSD